jgi:hypothetical protein
LSELDGLIEVNELNARLWAWIETIYHKTQHAGLLGLTPLERYSQDLAQIRLLGPLAAKLDEIFRHRIRRLVRKDGTVSYKGRFFEVPYELSGKTVYLVVDPHTGIIAGVEDGTGAGLGAATPLDALANRHRTRRKPSTSAVQPALPTLTRSVPSLVELAYGQHYDSIAAQHNPNHDPTSEDT